MKTWHFENAVVVSKEALWTTYFIALHAWSALVGCALFLAYPLWRELWRRWHPMSQSAPPEGSP